MALDGIFLHSILQELNKTILNGRIDKVNQPEKDEIILQIRGDKANYKVLLSSSSTFPRIHLTTVNKQNPLKAPMFCMVLRKYLQGARILNIKQVDTDRVLILELENTDELGFHSLYSLIVEIMGRHSNITLLRNRDNIIMDSIKHITPEINSFRSLYPGIPYIAPPESTKLNPFDFIEDTFISMVSSENFILDKNFLSKIFTGVSSTLSKELCFRLESKDIPLSLENLLPIITEVKTFLKDIKMSKFHYASYMEGQALKEFHCIPLLSYTSLKEVSYASPSFLLQDFYLEKDKYDRLHSKSLDVQKVIDTNLERCYKKIHLLQQTLKDCAEKDKLRLYGELLTAHIYTLKKGDKIAHLQNYYSEEETYIDIPLDENKTPSLNIQTYFKKYNKLKKSEEMAKEQISLTEDESAYLQSVSTNIKNVESYEEIEDIRKELVEVGYIRFKKEDKNKKTKMTKPYHYVSSDGFDIFVGKNNLQNDELTLKFASKNDIWLHTKNLPGSHVIIKNTGAIPETTLAEAANIAAFYSKGKDSSKVPVDYTEVKNVKKPSGAKPGMVIYYTNKTLYVTPTKTTLDKGGAKI